MDQMHGGKFENYHFGRWFRNPNIGRKPVQAQAHGGAGRNAHPASYHEALNST